MWWKICDKIVLQTYVLQLDEADVVQDRASTDKNFAAGTLAQFWRCVD